MEFVTLNNGVRMPQLGFGVWQVPDAEAGVAVAAAIEAGYRSIDTAKLYRNEEGVGRAVRASGVPREELFITTKLWNDDHGYDSALRAFDASMDRLGLDYLDLYLIHWPLPAHGKYVETWRALEKIYADGAVRAIGVSNFPVEQLEHVLKEGEVVPAINQIELHPMLPQAGLRAFHAEHGILTEAWSPLGQGRGLLQEPVLAELAAKHARTPAQVVLRWHLQLGNVVIPKSVTPSRITENFDVFGFELDAGDMAAIDALDTGTRLGPDPATFNRAG
ncbi:aldo/keto reductase [Planobispora takensis]|uniref:Oxidoreductase n=1 Tax=Planobispora takensis TaxID=1367882 RepID=A0A8J3SX06_9ACTN|nr:aldo/keto reductase [Planobispora takensis]GII00318.1 oxidoreductase [Planobispora takensis]